MRLMADSVACAYFVLHAVNFLVKAFQFDMPEQT